MTRLLPRFRFRTTINVLGDALGAGIVYHLSKNDLKDLTVEDEELTYGSGGMTQMNGKSNQAYENTSM